jgi:hypothetical protein
MVGVGEDPCGVRFVLICFWDSLFFFMTAFPELFFSEGILYVFGFGSGLHNLVTLSYRLVAGRRLRDQPLDSFSSPCPFHPCEVAAGRAISSTVHNYFLPNFLPGVVTRTDQSIKSNWKP